MNRDEILNLSGRELAEATAKMMGWKMCICTTSPCYRVWMYEGKQIGVVSMFLPDRSAKYDYLVLEHVREGWDREQTTAFCKALSQIWVERESGIRQYEAMYRSGDYARAALLALTPPE